MAKYSYEFKKQIVGDYLQGKGGFAYLSKKYGIGDHDHTQVSVWLKAYQTFGGEGLMRSRKNEIYFFEFKLHVVELYLTTEIAYQDLALSVGINNPPLITKWVDDYRIAGSDALKPKRKGRRRKVDKPKDITTDMALKSNDIQEYLK